MIIANSFEPEGPEALGMSQVAIQRVIADMDLDPDLVIAGRKRVDSSLADRKQAVSPRKRKRLN